MVIFILKTYLVIYLFQVCQYNVEKNREFNCLCKNIMSSTFKDDESCYKPGILYNIYK